MGEIVYLKGKIELIPLIEFEPWRYSDNPTEYIGGRLPDNDKERHCMWELSLAEQGIIGLQPVYRGSFFVRALDVVDPHILKEVIKREAFQNDEQVEEWRIDEVKTGEWRKIAAGYGLFCDDEIAIEPGCCCDLDDIDDWRHFSQYRGSQWAYRTIGAHTSYPVRYKDNHIIFSFGEIREGVVDERLKSYAVNVNDLEQAIEPARILSERFGQRILSLIDELYP